MTVMLVRLAFAGIRSRVLASALTIAIAGSAAAMIVLALEVRSSGVAERGAPVPLVFVTVGPRGSSDGVQLAGLSGRTT